MAAKRIAFDQEARSAIYRGVQKLAAVLGFPHRTGRDGANLIHAVRFSQAFELGQDLQSCMGRFRRQRAPVRLQRWRCCQR